MQQALTTAMRPVLTSNPTELEVPSSPFSFSNALACSPPYHFATHGRPGCLPPLVAPTASPSVLRNAAVIHHMGAKKP
jgi:hypothetical protein